MEKGICKNCQTKLEKGLKVIQCVECKENQFVYSTNTSSVCGYCSKEKNICLICGKELTQD